MILAAAAISARPHREILRVGPGQGFSTIEAAVAAARAGDTVEVYPSPGGYAGAHIPVRTPRLSIIGAGDLRVLIDGSGFHYSGIGPTPRAIFQIESSAEGTSIYNFELRGAHNETCNGAGIRINQARDVSIGHCDIHDNDMGIMSNGREGDTHAGENQLVDHCTIHQNGNRRDPGQNHNLYLGGASVTVQFCDICASLTGHNLKSRAHFNLIRYCFIHDSANRELDLVDDWDTARPNSNAVLLGNLIVKSPNALNHTTIHFGEERGVRRGTLFMTNNTIVTPFQAPVVEVDSPTSKLVFDNNVVDNEKRTGNVLVEFGKGGQSNDAIGRSNWLSSGYLSGWTGSSRYPGEGNPFREPGDYRLKPHIATPG